MKRLHNMPENDARPENLEPPTRQSPRINSRGPLH